MSTVTSHTPDLPATLTVRRIKLTESGALVQAPDGRQGWIRRCQLTDSNVISRALFDHAANTRAPTRPVRANVAAVTVVRRTDKGALVQGPDGRQGWIRLSQLPPTLEISHALYARACRLAAQLQMQREREATLRRGFGCAAR